MSFLRAWPGGSSVLHCSLASDYTGLQRDLGNKALLHIIIASGSLRCGGLVFKLEVRGWNVPPSFESWARHFGCLIISFFVISSIHNRGRETRQTGNPSDEFPVLV